MFGVGAESGSDFMVESLRDNGFGRNCASSGGDNLSVMSFFWVCFVFFSAFIFVADVVIVSVAVDIMAGRGRKVPGGRATIRSGSAVEEMSWIYGVGVVEIWAAKDKCSHHEASR